MSADLKVDDPVRSLVDLGVGDPEETASGTEGVVTQVNPPHYSYRYEVQFTNGHLWLVTETEIEAVTR